MLNNAPGRRILLPKVVAPALSPKTKVPVFFEGEWIELSIGDWSDLKVWGKAETSVLCWTGYRLEKILTKPPRILSELRNLTDIKTTANVIRTSHETQFLSLPGSGTVQVQEYMHPLVSGVTLRGASTLKFGDRLLCPMESEFLLLRDLPDIEKTNKVYTTQVEAIKQHTIPDDEYYYGYTLKVPDYGNLLLSSGVFVAT